MIQNPTEKLKQITKLIEIFSNPCRVSTAARKLSCSERNVLRFLAGMKLEGFRFKKLSKGYVIKEVPFEFFQEATALADWVNQKLIKVSLDDAKLISTGDLRFGQMPKVLGFTESGE